MITSPITTLDLSDHFFVECSLDIPRPNMSVSEVHYRKFRQIDIKHFKDDICASKLPNTTWSYVDEMADCYNKTLRFNDKLKKLKAKRRKLERRMIKSGLQCDKDAHRKVCNDYCTSLNETRKR